MTVRVNSRRMQSASGDFLANNEAAQSTPGIDSSSSVIDLNASVCRCERLRWPAAEGRIAGIPGVLDPACQIVEQSVIGRQDYQC